jgi:endonuclease/exonuclease/phosphatase family metal-dependent hydrolase
MKTSYFFILFLFFILRAHAQNNPNEFSILFYNVENLFDVKNDSLTNDDEFTFEGERHWSYKKLNLKLQNISKVILSSGGWNTPSLVAMCEIENRYVLESLLKDTPLKSIPYKIIHKESPDFRGIDVALLYNKEKFYPIEYEYYPLLDAENRMINSREILYVSGLLGAADTVHVFVNHWPSRYSGVMETRGLRERAALLLHEKIDLLMRKNSKAKIIVVGDFNDQPNDESLSIFLGAKEASATMDCRELYNLSEGWSKSEIGTLKYQSQWFVFDQIIVSGSLLLSNKGLFTKPEWANISKQSFLLEPDEKYGGLKPNRTYNGYRYNGGFSDHLPVVLKLAEN